MGIAHSSMALDRANGIASQAPAAAYPVSFSGNPGLFKPVTNGCPGRDVSVLFLSPWGLDELGTRRFFRIIAEDLADVGIASLRFDYPGTCNALDRVGTTIDMDCWTRAACQGADALRSLSGTRTVVLVGFGLGAAIAVKAAQTMENLAGLAFLAPVVAGKRYLRELSVWSTIIDEGVGVPAHRRDPKSGSIAGLTLPPGIVATLQELNAELFDAVTDIPIFLATRPDSASDCHLRERLSAFRATIKDCVFPDYDRLVENPHGQRFPVALMRDLIDWIKALPEATNLIEEMPAPPTASAVVTDGTVRETAVRMGDGDKQLIGTMCGPDNDGTIVTVVLLSTAYDHQAGWSRSGVELARRLAVKGIASLRFDSAGVGDSPPFFGRRDQVVYDDQQIADLEIVRSFLDTVGRTGPALLYGRCSGAYVAFRAAAQDTRWAGCIAVNPYVFQWLGTPSEEVARSAPRPLSDYSQRALRIDTFYRLIRGDINVGAAIRHIRTRLAQHLSNLLVPLLGPWMPTERLNKAVHADFRSLSQRQAGTRLVYSAGDVGLDNLYAHFGKDAVKLTAFPNTELHIIGDTDHNITPKASRDVLYGIVERAALDLACRSL